MNTKAAIAVALIVLGLVVLAYSGLTFTTPGQPIDFLGMHIATTENHYLSPAVGGIALIGGILLLVLKPRRV